MPLRRDDDEESGVVFNMTMSGNPIWNPVYSIQVSVGVNQQKFSLSVDTGSSDLWIASQGCSTSECSNSHATLYDPTNAVQTGQEGDLSYLRGKASGPIVWDSFTFGPYTIPSQALIAADTVVDENISPQFIGLLGLSLPPNSVITSKIPATDSDSPDGATVSQNLFGITPLDTAPARHFIGISLERPEPKVVPSLLSIGKHPSDSLGPGFDESKINFMNLVTSQQGDNYWRVPVTSITAWVDGLPKPIALGMSAGVPLSSQPVAILDTGGPPILASSAIANAIYGAYNISPAQDGNYYLPCTTPLNLTIALSNFQFPVHPLDLTSLPQTLSPGADTNTCVGIIQAYDGLGQLGDMVLGVAFMRNVYSVLSSESSPTGVVKHQLGLYPLTNGAQAMEEFKTVRVFGQSVTPGSQTHSAVTTGSGKKFGVGLIVLIAILGFFGLCAILFTIRWCCLRKRFKNEDAELAYGDSKAPPVKKEETELQEAPFLSSWESGKPGHLAAADGTRFSEYTRVDEMGIISKKSSSSLSGPTPRATPTLGDKERESDYFSEWHSRSGSGHSHTPSSGSITTLTTPAFLERGDQSPRIRESTRGRSPLISNVALSDDDSGMAGVGSRGSISMAGPTIRPVPRPRLAHDGSFPSHNDHRPWTSVEVGSTFDADFAKSIFDGLIPGPNMQLQDMIRTKPLASMAGRDMSISAVADDEAGGLHPPVPGAHIRTYSEGDVFRGHRSQPSAGAETPLLGSGT